MRLPGTVETIFRVLTALAAFAVMIYEGFTINYIAGIPFWNSSLLPATLISWAVSRGLALVSVIVSADREATALTDASRIVLIVTASPHGPLPLECALCGGCIEGIDEGDDRAAPFSGSAVVLIGIVVPLAPPLSAIGVLVSFIGPGVSRLRDHRRPGVHLWCVQGRRLSPLDLGVNCGTTQRQRSKKSEVINVIEVGSYRPCG